LLDHVLGNLECIRSKNSYSRYQRQQIADMKNGGIVLE